MTRPESRFDRRLDPRLPTHRPVKLQCLATGRYIPARTVDLSAGGALVGLDFPHHLLPGQKVRVGIAQNLSQAWLSSDGMAEGLVVRLAARGRQQQIAVRFDQRHPEAIPAAA
jgi:hypothetical protein